ncbi:hypothetical protein [Streptomyces sp. DH8]|uniref:Rv1733c family protein n=1 Tax=Streptomyces sp. DH8 TaxID=2857008 RepID=UPI001E3F2D6D|nr:hypothetical protein [Streptomyces sp. DH8]
MPRVRRGPPGRAPDRHEAWVALGALLLLLVGAPAAGWAGGSLADASLQRSVRSQQSERHAVRAVVVGPAAGPGRLAGDPEAEAEQAARHRVVASWRAPDGSPRTGEVATAARPGPAGSALRIWTDAAGLPVPPPMDGRTARTHAVLGGVGAFLLAAGCVEAGRRLIVRRLVRRRHERLDREWAATAPLWSRTGTGG